MRSMSEGDNAKCDTSEDRGHQVMGLPPRGAGEKERAEEARRHSAARDRPRDPGDYKAGSDGERRQHQPRAEQWR
jgi:hypothetical protein